jgi:uncharacterized protein (DUF1778 family)
MERTGAREPAEHTIRQHEVMILTMRDSVLLAEALLNPPEPSERLKAAFADYYKSTGKAPRAR